MLRPVEQPSPIDFTPWRVVEHLAKQEDGSTEIESWEIVDALGNRVVSDVNERENADAIVVAVNSRWPKLRVRVPARSGPRLLPIREVYITFDGINWWRSTDPLTFGLGPYPKEKIARQAARSAWTRPDRTLKFVVVPDALRTKPPTT